MADISSTFRYDGDFGPLRAEIRLLAKDISAINSQFKAFDKTAQQSMLSLATALQRDLASIRNFKTSVVDITSTVDSFGNAVSKSKLTLREYAREASQAFRSTSNTRKLAEREVAKLQSTLVELGNVGGRKKGLLVKPLTADLTSMTAKTMLARKQFEIFNTLVQDGATKLIDFGKNTQWAGRQLMVGLSLPLAMMGTTITKTFLDVEKELTRFAKVYGSDLTSTTKEATESMKSQVLELSKTIAREYGIAAKETAGLAADLAATGLEGQRLLRTVEQTSKLAVLGEVDRQDAMKATLSLQNAFNMSTKELADSVNFLNSVENQTSTSLQDLITAIPKTGPVINALGGDVKDLASLLVAMKEGGVEAGEGANAIKSGLASLINPTKRASEVAKQYGIDIEGIVKSTRGELMPTILNFQKALSGLDEFGRAQVIEQIFGKYQFARISALFDNLNKEGSQTKKILELSTLSAIDLAKQAYREMQTLSESAPVRMQRAIESLKAELLPLGASIAENVVPIISKFAEIVGNIVDFLEKLPTPTKNFLKITAAVTALLGPIVMLVGLFANFGGNVVKLTMNFVNMVRAMAGIKTGRFQMLSDEQLSAKFASDKLTQSFDNQENALNRLNTSLQVYLTKLSQLSQTKPGLFNPARPIRRANGGYVSGPGGPKEDKIPAMLSDGEYVIKASSVNKYGRGTLDEINAGRFAKGGMIGYNDGTKTPISTDSYSTHNGEKLQRGHIGTSGFINMMPESINRRLMRSSTNPITGGELAQWFEKDKGYSLMAGVGKSLGMNEKYIKNSIEHFKSVLVQELLKNPGAIYGGWGKTDESGRPLGLNFEEVVGDRAIAKFVGKQKGWKILQDVKHIRTQKELEDIASNPKYSSYMTKSRVSRYSARLSSYGEHRTAGLALPEKLIGRGISSYVGTKGGGGRGLKNFLLKGFGIMSPIRRAMGGPTEGNIPAMLSNGEYVMSAKSVKKYGPGFMGSLNSGTAKFAKGGFVRRFQDGGPTQMTHATMPRMTSPSELLAAAEIGDIHIRDKFVAALQKLQLFIDAYGAGAVEIKQLSNLVLDLPAKLNQDLKGAGVVSAEFASQFKKEGLQKYIPILTQTGMSLKEAKSTLEILDSEVISAAKMFDRIDDPTFALVFEEAMTRVKQMDPAFASVIKKMEGLARAGDSIRIKLNLSDDEIKQVAPEFDALGRTIKTLNGQTVRLTQTTEKLNNAAYYNAVQLQKRAAVEAEFGAMGIPYIPHTIRNPRPGGNPVIDTPDIIDTAGDITPSRTATRMSLAEQARAASSGGEGMGGGAQGAMGAIFAIQSLGYTMSNVASATDKGTKALNLFLGAMEAMWVLGSLKAMGGAAGGMKNLFKRSKDISKIEGLEDLSGALGGKMATGLGGKLQASGIGMADKAKKLRAISIAQQGKGTAMGKIVGKGASGASNILSKLGPQLTKLGPMLSNPYVLAASAGVAVIGGLTMFFINKHKQMLEKVKKDSSSAFTSAKEAAKMYGAELKTVNTVLEENRRLTGDIKTPGQKKAIVGQQDLTKLVKTQYKDFVSNIKDAAFGAEAQNELSLAYQNMLAQGLQPEAAQEILGEVARQSGRMADFGNFLDTILLKGMDSHERRAETSRTMGERLASTVSAAMSFAVENYDASAEGIAVANKFIGGINTAILQGSTDIASSNNAISSMFESARALAKNNPQIEKNIKEQLTSIFENAGMSLDDPAIKKALANPLSNLAKYTLQAISAGADPAEVNKVYKEAGESGMKYLAADFQARKAAQQQNAKWANERITELQKELKIENNAYEAKKAALQDMIDKENDYHENIMDKYEQRKEKLQDEIDEINKNTDAYIKSLEKKKDEESFYAQQRKSTLDAMKAFAEGDVFGFLQARQDISAQAGEYGIQQEINRVEDTRDAAVDAREEEIRLIELAEKAEDSRHEKRLAQIAQWQKATVAAQNALNTSVNAAIDNLSAYANADIQEQEKLAAKLEENFTGKNGVLTNISKSSKFFKEEDKTELDGRIQKLKGSFSKVADVFSSGLQSGISTAAKSLGVDEGTLKDVLLKSLGASFDEELPEATAQEYPSSNAENVQYANNAAKNPYKKWKFVYDKNNNVWKGYKPGSKDVGTSISNLNTSALNFIGIKAMANGGRITGPGGPKSDLIPAMLSNGEYVVNAKAVSRMGLPAMERINSLGFAMGGFAAPNYSAPMPKRMADGGAVFGSTNNTYSIIINANGADADEVYRKFQRELERCENASNMSRRV